MGQAEMIGWLLLAGVGAAGWHAVMCWVAPFTYCRRCGGSGKRKPWVFKRTKNHGRCRKCGGRGERLRTGRLVWNKITGS